MKVINTARRYGRHVPVAAAATFLPVAAFAQETADYSAITGAVALTGVVAAIVAIGAVLMAPKVAMKGARMILGMVR